MVTGIQLAVVDYQPRRTSLITDLEAMQFLQWCLPQLGLRWAGYRKIRSRLYKRLKRRVHELGLSSFEAYQNYLLGHAEEWVVLSSLCWMPITRFYRDRDVFQHLALEILPELTQLVSAGPDKQLRCWSAGCASGEEPHTLAILWQHGLAQRYPAVEFRVIATDIDPKAIQRALRGCYHWSSLKEMPADWRAQAFNVAGDELCLKNEYRHSVTFLIQDLRESVPEGIFQLILCRNLAFTYFDPTSQKQTLHQLLDKLAPGGALIIGKLETLPEGCAGVEVWLPHMGVYRKRVARAII